MISVISINEDQKWDGIVKSFKNYEPHYLSAYAKAFQLHGDGEPLLYYYDDGSTRAMNVVMKRDIAEAVFFKNILPPNKMFDISTPYGYGGFWVEGGDCKALNRAYDNYCCEQGYVSEFVRFHLFSGYQPHYSGTSYTNTHNVVRSLALPLDEITREFAHKVRTNLRRASASGLQVEIDPRGDRLDDFLKIYYGTMNRKNATEDYFFPKKFFDTINKLNNNCVYIHVISEGQVVSTEIVLYGGENCYSFLGGTNREFFNLRPNEFLKYEVIKWAKENGFKNYVLGGGYGVDDELFKYKKYFAPNGVCDFYIGKKIFDQEKYAKLVAIRKAEAGFDITGSFFPEYRTDRS
jgi:hypothetical protein